MIDHMMESYLVPVAFAPGEVPKAGDGIGVSTPTGEHFDAEVVSVCQLRRTGVVRMLAQRDDGPITSRQKSWLRRGRSEHGD